MSNYNFKFQIKTKIKFGRNKIKELPEILKSKNKKRVMLVIDEGIKKVGILEKITLYLDDKLNIVSLTR